MNLSEFQTQYRNAIDETLNQLQTVVLLLAQLEARITNVGQDLQNLSQTVEEFAIQQMLDTDSDLVSLDQTNEFQLSGSPQMETSSFTTGHEARRGELPSGFAGHAGGKPSSRAVSPHASGLPNTKWPSPVVYPLRPPKGRKSLAAIELPTFKGVRG